MAFYPVVLLSHLPVFVIVPADEARSDEAGRVNGEVRLYRLQRQTALRDESLQDRSQFGILKIIENRIVVGSLGDEAVCLRFAKIGHKAPSRNRGVDLECRAEYCVGQWQARPSHPPYLWFRDSSAQIGKQ